MALCPTAIKNHIHSSRELCRMPGVGGKANNLEQEKESKSCSDPLNAKMILVAEFERAGATQWPLNLYPPKEPEC